MSWLVQDISRVYVGSARIHDAIGYGTTWLFCSQAVRLVGWLVGWLVDNR